MASRDSQSQRAVFWTLAVGVLVVVVGSYLIKDVSHEIDLVQIEAIGIQNEREAVLVESHGDELVKRTTAPFTQGIAVFRNVPQGAYSVLIPTKRCEEAHASPYWEPSFRTSFSFARTQRWEKPSALRMLVDLNRCEIVNFIPHTRSTWKWSW